jgi:hypothetical protein
MNGGNRLTVPYLLKLLEIDSLPGGKLLEAFALDSAARLIAEHGEDWIRKQRVRLVQELEYITQKT